MQYYSSNGQDYSSDGDFHYGRDESGQKKASRSSRRSQSASADGRRRSGSGYNGMHRRRNKHWSW